MPALLLIFAPGVYPVTGLTMPSPGSEIATQVQSFKNLHYTCDETQHFVNNRETSLMSCMYVGQKWCQIKCPKQNRVL